jgi:hypothetical protein
MTEEERDELLIAMADAVLLLLDHAGVEHHALRAALLATEPMEAA